MGWIEEIGKSISYIEDHITEALTIESIAKQALVSPFYFGQSIIKPGFFSISR